MEKNITKCKVCLQLKERILVGKFDDKNKKYTDETNKLWNGKTCPSCVVEKSRLNMQKLRSKKNEI